MKRCVWGVWDLVAVDASTTALSPTMSPDGFIGAFLGGRGPPQRDDIERVRRSVHRLPGLSATRAAGRDLPAVDRGSSCCRRSGSRPPGAVYAAAARAPSLRPC